MSAFGGKAGTVLWKHVSDRSWSKTGSRYYDLSLKQLRAEGLVNGTDPFFNGHAEQLAELALRERMPAIYQYHKFTAAGGLMSYGGPLTKLASSCRHLRRPYS